MKNAVAIVGMFCMLLVGLAVIGSAQEKAPGPLQEAAQALADGSESQAWQLYKENEAAFRQQWKELDPDLVAWVADQYRKQKRYKDCLALCDRILAEQDKISPELTANVMLVKGDVFRDRENYAAARLEYQGIERHDVLKKTEAGKTARFRSVDVLRITRDYEGAEEIIERLLDYPDLNTQAEAYYLRARIAFDRESYEEAREYIEEVKKRMPEHVETLFLEAELNLREDRLQDPELEIGSRVLMTYVVPGRPITMKMQDRNLAVVRGGAGVPVEIVTSEGGDKEVVSLLPSPRDATLFRGLLSTKLGDPEPGNLLLEVNGSDVVRYNLEKTFQQQNELQYDDKKMLVVADAELTATSGDFITNEERDQLLLEQRLRAAQNEDLKAYERERNTNIIRPGNEIRVQVIDYDRDMGRNLDNVFVGARTSSGDTVDGIELTETEPHSGLFRGTIPTVTAPPRATASGSAGKSNPGWAISSGNSGVWKSAAEGDEETWYEVDLMTLHPVQSAVLDFVKAGNVKHASLFAAAGGELKKIASTRPDREDVYGYLDLKDHFGEQSQTAAYVYTEITSGSDQDAVFKIGSCDGVTCWLNGERVHLNLGGRSWTPEEDVVPVKLKSGINAILLQVKQLTGPWGVSLTVTTADGEPLGSIPEYPPAQPGVITKWYVFDRLTPEKIRVGNRVDVRKPIRVLGKLYEWIARDVSPAASLEIDDSRLVSEFHGQTGLRRLRWVFGELAEPAVSVSRVTVENKFGDTIVPADVEFSSAATNRVLELGPGDRIRITYDDERRVRTDGLVFDTMQAGFYNARIVLAYETITLTEDGERLISYDPAVRYRAGKTDRLVALVEDYDADVSDDLDRVRVLVENSEGEETWLEAVESEPHSGEFIAILRLGDTTGQDAIRVGANVAVSASYEDTENSDGRIERKAVVNEAADDPPELFLYQAVVLYDTENLIDEEDEGPILRLRAPVRDEEAATPAPVVTSLDTSLVFKVVYPDAALSSNATFEAELVTEREMKAAQAAGTDVPYQAVSMRLSSAKYAEFEAQVPVRIGDRSAYADALAGSAEQDRETDEEFIEPFYARGDDVILVTVKALDGSATETDRFLLASDAAMEFTDGRYEQSVDSMYLGDFASVRLLDRDRDVSDELDDVTVTLSAKSGERELVLTETLPHSGVFVGRVKTEQEIEATPEEAAAEAAEEADEDVFRVAYSDHIRAKYSDELCVVEKDARDVTATVSIHPGADATMATFTKRFRDEDIAVKTRLLTAEALFELAKDHRDTGQKDLADKEIAEGKTILEEAIADYPNTKHAPHAEFLLANLAQELEKFDEALERYNTVLSSWPDSEFAPRAQLKKGICLEKLEDYDNALDSYVELTYSYPSSTLVADAVVRLGQHFYRTKDFDVAGKVFANFHDNHPEHELAAKALFLSGQSYLKGAEDRKQLLEGRYDNQAMEWLQEAIAKFDQLISAYDDKDLRAEAMYWQADSYMKTADMRNAYLTFKKLTWDYPESKWAKFARGQLVQNANAFDRVKED